VIALAASATSAGALFAKVLPLAVGAAISPTALVVVLFVLGGRSHPRARAAALTAGFVTVLAALAAVSLLFLRRSVTSQGGGSSLYAWIDVGFGVLLVVLGVRALVRHPAPKAPPTGPANDAAHLARFFGIGFALMLTNFSTIVLCIPAMKDVAIADVGTGTKAAAVVLVLAFAAAPVWVPVLLYTVAPRFASRALGVLIGALGRHQQAVSVTVCFVFAVYLLVKGGRAL
jgi:hypothetical protein